MTAATTNPPATDDEKEPRFIGLRLKIVIGFTLVFTVVFAVAYYWFFTFAEDLALVRVRQDLADTLTGAGEGLDPQDFAQAKALIADGAVDLDGRYYPLEEEFFSEHARWLSTVHGIEPRAWVYTFIAGPEENQVTYLANNAVIDVGPSGEEPGSAGVVFGQVGTDGEGFNLQNNFVALKQGEVHIDPESYGDNFGRWISGYYPVRDNSGQVVGAVGVDFQADYINQVRQSILDQVFVAFLITYVSLFVLVILLSQALANPIQRLTGAAREIARGNYNDPELDAITNRQAVTRDEIFTLGRVLREMRDEVYRREQALKTQVRELKIEIDEVKAKQQVAEIVDTDFFSHLQERVQDLRKRGEKTDDD